MSIAEKETHSFSFSTAAWNVAGSVTLFARSEWERELCATICGYRLSFDDIFNARFEGAPSDSRQRSQADWFITALPALSSLTLATMVSLINVLVVQPGRQAFENLVVLCG
jgi:hypothetical protein